MVTENRKRYLFVFPLPDLFQIFLNFWGDGQLENCRILHCFEMFLIFFKIFLCIPIKIPPLLGRLISDKLRTIIETHEIIFKF